MGGEGEIVAYYSGEGHSRQVETYVLGVTIMRPHDHEIATRQQHDDATTQRRIFPAC
jgi:hypothetical protein